MVDVVPLLIADILGIPVGQMVVQYLLNGHPNGSAGLLALLPVEDQLFVRQRGQQLAGDLLDLPLLLLRQVHLGTGEDVEQGEFLLRQLLADVALVFFAQALGKVDQLVKERLDVKRTLVVFVDQSLEFVLIVDAASIAAQHTAELGGDGTAQPLGLGPPAALLELLLESVKVDLAQVVCARPFADDVSPRLDRFIEQAGDLGLDVRRLQLRGQAADICCQVEEEPALGAELSGTGIGQTALNKRSTLALRLRKRSLSSSLTMIRSSESSRAS